MPDFTAVGLGVTTVLGPCDCCVFDVCPRCGTGGDAVYLYYVCNGSCSPAPGIGIILQGTGADDTWSVAFVGGGGMSIECSVDPDPAVGAVVNLTQSPSGPFDGQLAYFIDCGEASGLLELRFRQNAGWDVCNADPGGPESDCIAVAVDYHPQADCLQAHFGTANQTFTLDGSATWPGAHTAVYDAVNDWWLVTFPPGTVSYAFYFEHGFMWTQRRTPAVGSPIVCRQMDCTEARWNSGTWGGTVGDGVLS